MRIFHLVLEDGSVAFSNLEENPQYYNLYSQCSSNNELVESNGKKYRHGRIRESSLEFYFLTDEKIKSSRLFKEFRYVYFETLKKFIGYERVVANRVTVQANRILHNIVSYNAHTIQSIYSLIPQEQFTNLKTKDLKEIQEIITENTEKTALTILNILKNNNLMKAELSVFNKLYNENPDLNYLDHPIHKIVRLVINTYWLDFIRKDVQIRIGSCKKYVNIDYESFLASFVHVIENALKYSLPKTDVNILFETDSENLTLTLDMISLRISEEDLENIYEEGYSGELPRSLNKEGKGIGMYMVKRLLELSNVELEIKVNVDESKKRNEKGIDYENNQFKFTLPLSD